MTDDEWGDIKFTASAKFNKKRRYPCVYQFKKKFRNSQNCTPNPQGNALCPKKLDSPYVIVRKKDKNT